MSRNAAVLALVALLATAARVEAREPATYPVPDTALRTINLPPALPGAVITATVDVPAGVRGRGAARFVIVTSPYVRLFGRTSGTFAAGATPTLIPLTFILARDQEAGPMRVATVTLTWDDGKVYTTELLLEVQPLRRVRLLLAAASEATPARPLVVRYRVANLGNSADSVGLRVVLPAGWHSNLPRERLPVLHNDSIVGSFVVRVPPDAASQAYSLAVTAAGVADTSIANLYFRIGSDNPGSSWVAIPGTLFLGLPSVGRGETDPDISLEARGRADPATEIALTVRRPTNAVRPPVFYRYGAGPELQATLTRPEWRVAAGDVYVPLGGIVGSYGFGTGGDVTWRKGTFGELFVARPREYGSRPLDGYLARGEFGIPTETGDFSVRLTDFSRPLSAGLAEDHTRAATLAFEPVKHGAHQLRVEAGYSAVATDSLTRGGPAVDASYAYQDRGAFALARVRRVPGVLPGSSSSNEAYLGGGLPLVGRVSLLGWGSTTSLPVLGQATTSRTDATLGLRAGGGPASLQLRGTYSHTSAPAILQGGIWSEYGLTANASLPLGVFSLDANGSAGVVRLAESDQPLRTADLHASWRGPLGSLWLGSSYSRGRFGEMPLRLDGGGSLAYRGFELDGGLGVLLSRANGTYLGVGWGAATLPLPLGSAVVVGADYQPWMPVGSRVRVSAGFKATVSVPVLVPRRASASGVTFEDRNADGLRQPQEPVLPGVGLRLGTSVTTTDERGRFAFARQLGARAPLQVDMASLPIGWLVESYAATARKVDVPLVRAGALRVRLVAEESVGAAGPDSTGTPVAGVWLELVDGEGRQRSAVSDSSGIVRFGALPPGRYSLTVHPVGARGQPLPDRNVSVEVPYGEGREVVVTVPTRPLEIRFNSTGAPASTPPARR